MKQSKVDGGGCWRSSNMPAVRFAATEDLPSTGRS